MEILKNATKIASKYGISFYKFDPYLSYVNNKLGLCIKLNTFDYGYLTRNFTFDNLKDFEDFVKKYSYYKNKLKCNSFIKFDDYMLSNPKVLYDFDEKLQLEKENEIIEINAIIDCGLKFKVSLQNLYEDRLEQISKRNNIRAELEFKLNEYKKNLYTYYDKDYEETFMPMDTSYKSYQVKAKKNLSSFDKVVGSLERSNNLLTAKENMQHVIEFLKDLEKDEEYFSLIYDMYLYKNKIVILEKMNTFLIEMLNSENKISYQELKEKLDIIKTSIPFNNTKQRYIDECILEIDDKYQGLDEISVYNYYNYLNELPFEVLKYKESSFEIPAYKDELKKQYDLLSVDEKDNLLLLFSPFRNIINCITGAILNNELDNFNFSLFEDFYNEIVEIVEKTENVIFAKKYFNKISFASFAEFMDSIIVVSNKIINISMNLKDNANVWAYIDSKDNYIVCYDTFVKVDNISKINIKEGSLVLFSKKAIKYKDSSSYCLEIVDNEKCILIQNKNILKLNDECLEVSEYKYDLDMMCDLNIVKKISVDKTYKYLTYDCYAKVSDEIK